METGAAEAMVKRKIAKLKEMGFSHEQKRGAGGIEEKRASYLTYIMTIWYLPYLS